MYLCMPGRTEEEVINALGMPTKIIKKGEKQDIKMPLRPIRNKVLVYRDTYIYINEENKVEALYMNFR